MQKVYPLFFSLLCCSLFLRADESSDLPGYRAAYLFQTVDVDYLSICPAKSRSGHFSYGDKTATINTNLFAGPNSELSLLAGFRQVHMKLNTHFKKQNSLYGVLGLNAKYSGSERWVWLSSLIAQPNLFSRGFYAGRYIGLLHGRYIYNDGLGLHVGAYAELGMRTSNIKPLVGLDYTRGAWTYQLIYPLKAGVTYSGISQHLISLMLRPFYTVVRDENGFNHHGAITEYQGSGLELRWDWLPLHRWDIWASLGNTASGRLFVGDHNNHHRHHIHLHTTPYFQVGILFEL